MGGMFPLQGARQPAASDYCDPGDYAQPAGTQAYANGKAPLPTPQTPRVPTRPARAPGAATARQNPLRSHQH